MKLKKFSIHSIDVIQPTDIEFEFNYAESLKNVKEKYIFHVNTKELTENIDLDEEFFLDPSNPYYNEDQEELDRLKHNNIADFLRLDHLDKNEKLYVTKLVEKYRNSFYIPGDDLPGTDAIMHRIPTIDDIPVNTKQYKFPHALKEEIIKQMKELLKLKIIRPSNAAYNIPLWIVPKKANSEGIIKWRVVLDFRWLNEKTINDSYPLPNITEIFDQVGGAKYYSVKDLAKGFLQIKLDPNDSPKTAFSTPFGHYKFVRMPFGLKTAPATFQRLMDTILQGLQGEILFVYLDEIVIFANSIKKTSKTKNEATNGDYGYTRSCFRQNCYGYSRSP